MPTVTQRRKDDHLRINLLEDVQHRTPAGFDQLRFQHVALPEIDFDEIDTSTLFLGKRLRLPLLISGMTGGVERGQTINARLAACAEAFGCAMGVGSQRVAIENRELGELFDLRRHAPTAPLYANLGAIQLNHGYGIDECRRAVDMISADALVLHLNPLQEAVMKGGDTAFAGLLGKIEQVCRHLDCPVIVKEIGFGISARVARQLADAGAAAIDISGAGGTSWSAVEGHRAGDVVRARLAATFRDWGIPTIEALTTVRRAVPELPVIASGGVRTGLDVAKALALGATLAGMAGPLLRAAAQDDDTLHPTFEAIELEIRLAMFCTGSPTLHALQQATISGGGAE